MAYGLCTVDVLGEGVDIVSISHILLLRPDSGRRPRPAHITLQFWNFVP